MASFLLTVLTAVYFMRPTEWISFLEAQPLYELIIVVSLVLALGGVLRELSFPSWKDEPVTLAVAGLFVTVLLSEVFQVGRIELTLRFAKICLFYLLMLAILNTTEKFSQFITALGFILTVNSALMILTFHGYLGFEISTAVEESVDAVTGQVTVVERLESLGSGQTFDANDVAMLSVIGMAICLGRFMQPGGPYSRFCWLASSLVLVYCLYLTQSRGGLVAGVCTMGVLASCRWGLLNTILGSAVALPILGIVFSGRMTDLSSLRFGTGQERMQLWTNALVLLKENPVLGLGPGGYFRSIGKACHNSFMQAFAELGMLGGSLFLGALVLASIIVFRLRERAADDPAEKHQFSGLLAAFAGYSVAITGLNHVYSLQTYLLLALSTISARLYREQEGYPVLHLNSTAVGAVALAGVAFVVSMHLAMQLFVYW